VKFNNCLHKDEPKCAVKEALEKDEIAWSRYNSYLKLLEGMMKIIVMTFIMRTEQSVTKIESSYNYNDKLWQIILLKVKSFVSFYQELHQF
jgi:Cdc6-like AAA superfamily ATPase